MSDVRAIPIELIRLDGGTQIRDCKTMQTKIEEYLAAMVAGAQFPPLTVFWDGEHYWLADGFHRLGANNIFMQSLKLPGLDMECEVIEGTLREAIIYACGVNAAHGIQRTVPDKQNAVQTMLTNPLVMINLETGKPWNDSEIARRCAVGHDMVRRRREAILRAAQDTTQERAVTRGGTTYTMKTANIGSQTGSRKTEGPAAQPEAKDPPAPTADETSEEEQDTAPAPETPAKTAVVVEFKSKWDFIYDRVKEIDRAIEALPEPDEAAANFPETLAHGLTVERCLEIQHWWLEFTRYWAARNPGIQRRHPDFFEENFSVNAD
jgi:hypothetical protein